MAEIQITIPPLLAGLIGGERHHTVEADTVRQAVDALFRLYPELEVHIFDETGTMRPHVNIFNDRARARTDAELAQPVAEQVTIIQAVSGG